MKARVRSGKRPAAAATRPKQLTVDVEVHNRVLKAGYRRAAELEPRLADAVRPLLHRAGVEASRRFERLAAPVLTAAGEPTGWSAPAGDELLDLDSLIASLRARTDPIRQAVAEQMIRAGLGEVGISFDATNPFAARVLAQSASQITNIAQTTQLNVMRIIGRAHDEGLSVPQTASLIREGMADASATRAALIARTELAAAANGGSLAATQIVEEATGDNYVKQWLTAPGAPHPRHEEYEGLDGQTVALDDLFDVGGTKLAFPGDPDAPPDEVCNCRCTLAYLTAADAAAEAGDGGGGGGGVDLTSDFGGAEEAAVEDTVSVGDGPPVAADVLRVIADKGLNVYEPQKGATALRIFGAEKDTFALYSHDGEFTAERAKIHDAIVKAHFEGKVASEERNAYFTAGGSAAGKSALRFSTSSGDVSLEQLAARRDVIHIDPDAIKAMLPEYAQMRDAGDAYAAAGVHEESSIIAKRIMNEALSRGYSVVSDTTGSSEGFVTRLERFHQEGYEVKVSMVSVPTNEAITRSISRGGHSGRYVAIPHLKDAHSGASAQLVRWQDKHEVQEWRLYDNSGTHAELVAHGGGGVVEVLDPAKWEAILAKANE